MGFDGLHLIIFLYVFLITWCTFSLKPKHVGSNKTEINSVVCDDVYIPFTEVGSGTVWLG
jgi:hypothetical protein